MYSAFAMKAALLQITVQSSAPQDMEEWEASWASKEVKGVHSAPSKRQPGL
jgi:hypothetical protein